MQRNFLFHFPEIRIMFVLDAEGLEDAAADEDAAEEDAAENAPADEASTEDATTDDSGAAEAEDVDQLNNVPAESASAGVEVSLDSFECWSIDVVNTA